VARKSWRGLHCSRYQAISGNFIQSIHKALLLEHCAGLARESQGHGKVSRALNSAWILTLFAAPGVGEEIWAGPGGACQLSYGTGIYFTVFYCAFPLRAWR